MMDRARTQRNEMYYMIGIICLCVSLGLFALSLYILPNLAFGWRYEMPEFVSMWRALLQERYHFGEKASEWLIFFVFFFPAILFAIVADIFSNRIEKQWNRTDSGNSSQAMKSTRDGESNRLIIKIIGIIILVFITAQFFQWMISTSPLPNS